MPIKDSCTALSLTIHKDLRIKELKYCNGVWDAPADDIHVSGYGQAAYIPVSEDARIKPQAE